MWLYILIGVIALIIIYVFIVFNSFIHYRNKINEAFSTMDVYLKKRWDLIPNLVEVVKGYAKHEKETLESVIKLRGNTYNNLSVSEKEVLGKNIAEGISKIMFLSESYPELKADKSFQNLSKELSKVEDEIASSRKYYNGVIRLYNNKVEMFPSNIIAKIFGYKKEKMFEIEENEKRNVEVEF